MYESTIELLADGHPFSKEYVTSILVSVLQYFMDTNYTASVLPAFMQEFLTDISDFHNANTIQYPGWKQRDDWRSQTDC
jgi:hypothetical protein